MDCILSSDCKKSNMANSKSAEKEKPKMKISPILKWTRDEKYIIEELKKHIPNKFSSYWEAYAGGGALLFEIQQKRAVVNVLDRELYNIYKAIRDENDCLIEHLKQYKNEKEYYYNTKKLDTSKMNTVEAAAHFIYLSKTCFNGFFRKDENGNFDVPFGSYKNTQMANKIILKKMESYLEQKSVKLISRSFESLSDSISEGSFVYIAPENNLNAPKASQFHESLKLKLICDKLNMRGVKFLISHSHSDHLSDAFSRYEIIKIKVNKNIRAADGKKEDPQELIIKNYL